MKETVIRLTKELRKRPVTSATTGLVGLAALTGCGNGETKTVTETVPVAPAPAKDRAPALPKGVTISFPDNVQPHVNLRPATMKGPKGDGAPCEQFWQDEDKKRRPLVQDDPVVVRVDGRCNVPLDDPHVGVYNTPSQESPSKPTFIAQNGDALAVDHYTTGQWVQDIRGGVSGSDVWLAVINSAGEEGFVPEVNVGYVDERGLLEKG